MAHGTSLASLLRDRPAPNPGAEPGNKKAARAFLARGGFDDAGTLEHFHSGDTGAGANLFVFMARAA
jgi:hypothetical protein